MTHRLPPFAPEALAGALRPGARLFELSHEMGPAMPVFHQHVPYSLALHRRHGDPHPRPRPDRSSFANEIIVTSGHSGTHIDALGHFSRCGCLHGGLAVAEVETRDGFSCLDAAAIPPIFQPAVLLDVAAARGVEALEPGEVVSAGDLAAAEVAGAAIEPGDAVLIRTGWSRHWGDRELFVGLRGGLPGPDEAGTRWLLDRGATLLGSDTPAYECMPIPGRSVHAMLLVDEGVHIVENLVLDELSGARCWRALLIVLPLRLAGSTGSPIRAVAIG